MLDDIVAYKAQETAQRKANYSLSYLESRIQCARATRSFERSLVAREVTVIAESKYRSPSKGILRADYDPLVQAHAYQKGGAAALSVLADSRFFGNGPYVVGWIANAPSVHLPVMYKDFIVDEFQVYEARALGADAILIIVRILSPEKFKQIYNLAVELGLDVLVETFDEEDICRALSVSARIIGINNRDLDTFKVNFDRTAELFSLLPSEVVGVAESGISGVSDFRTIKQLGFRSALIGEYLLCADDSAEQLSSLIE
ncbi:indole-3-glycerol phosphate synthase TrpC [Pseudomonas benzopyrenica]|uniref:indole-3-glycerol phosphate synthase TrpC n=1 Tax=Pseudomonas benzopyrenica TaxID=2993566 RepID=UPI0039C10409